jgi:hypothetical protein
LAAYITGAVMGALSLIGLFLASRAHDGTFYLFGLLLFLFGVLYVFALIHKHTGHPPAGE